MSKKLLNTQSIEIHCCSIRRPVRSCPLIMRLWRTPQIIEPRKIMMSACIHTHAHFFVCPFFPSGLWYFDVPFRFKGHSKLSAISSSLYSSLSCLFWPSLPTIASVYFAWTL